MPSSRRAMLAAGATGTLALTAGCLDFVLGDGLEFEADRAAPADAALEETGYDEDEISEESFEETVEFGVERDVTASFWVSSYTNELSAADVSADDVDVSDDETEYDEDDLEQYEDEDLEQYEDEIGGDDDDALDSGPTDVDGSTFVAVSSPAVEVLGRTFNPLAEMDNEELLEEFMGEVDADADAVEHEETNSLDVLGDERDVDLFRGETQQGGESVTVDILLSSFVHEDDHIVLVGSYPDIVEGESEAVETLMESVEHPA
ncbi:DUF6517 family protein [Natrialbaceae archaeon A-arb3/5]